MKQTKNIRLTKCGVHELPALKNPLHIERAISKLYDFENLNLSVSDIEEMRATVEMLQAQIKRFEQWD